MRSALFAHWGLRHCRVSLYVAASSAASAHVFTRFANCASDPPQSAPSIAVLGAVVARAAADDYAPRYAGDASTPWPWGHE